MFRIVFALLALAFFAGCSTTPQRTDVVASAPEVFVPQLPGWDCVELTLPRHGVYCTPSGLYISELHGGILYDKDSYGSHNLYGEVVPVFLAVSTMWLPDTATSHRHKDCQSAYDRWYYSWYDNYDNWHRVREACRGLSPFG